MPAVKGVGEPCAGEPHARFDGRALETEQSRQPNTAAPGKPRDLSPDLTYHRHRASARPYSRTSAQRPRPGGSEPGASRYRRGCGPSCREVKDQLKRRRHQPIPDARRMAGERGARAPRLLRRARQQPGCPCVPDPGDPALVCGAPATGASAHRVTWTRMSRLATRWLPASPGTASLPRATASAPRTRGRSPVR